MKRLLTVLFVSAGAAIWSACIKSETSHVLYLAPSGAVTWAVHHRDVHSDEEDGSKRAREEADFLRAIQNRTHPPLLALEAVGGLDASTALIRAERPWDALTTARFDRIDTLCAALLREFGLDGRATLTSGVGRTTLRVEWTDQAPVDEESPAIALVEDLQAYRVVLTEGRFLSADGFVIAPDRRSATVSEDTAPAAERHVSLTWTAAPGR